MFTTGNKNYIIPQFLWLDENGIELESYEFMGGVVPGIGSKVIRKDFSGKVLDVILDYTDSPCVIITIRVEKVSKPKPSWSYNE